MGWWKTVNDGYIGDEPADILGEYEECPRTPADIPIETMERINGCYIEAFGRKPTEQELIELVAFCR